MNLAQKIAYHTSIQLTGRLVSIFVGLVTLRLTTTYLGVETFGQFSVVVALTGVVATIGELGVKTTLARELAKDPAGVDRLGGDLLPFRVYTSILGGVVVLAAVPFLPYAHATKVALAISVVGLVFTILSSFPQAYFQAALRMEYVAALDVGTRALNLAVIVVVRAFSLGLYSLVALIAVVNILICVATFVMSRSFWRINWRVNWQRARPIIRDAVGIGFISMIGFLQYRGDAILLSLMKPAAAVGIYTVAYRFVDQAFVIPGLLLATVFPILTRALHSDRETADRTIKWTFHMLVLGGLAIAIFVYTLAPFLVRLVAGPSFDAAVRPLQILAFALLPLFALPVFFNVLIAINKQRTLITIGAVSLGLNVILNLVLIPPYSYNGAAVGTVISEMFSLVVLFSTARRNYRFEIQWAFLWRVAVAASLAIGAVAALESRSQWLAFASSEALLCVTVLGLRAVTLDEMKVIVQRPQG